MTNFIELNEADVLSIDGGSISLGVALGLFSAGAAVGAATGNIMNNIDARRSCRC